MKRFLTLTTLLTSMLILTACAAPTPLPTATLTPSPTVTASPTKTPSPTPTATLPYQPLEGSTYREIARYELKGGISQGKLSPDGSMLAVLADDGVYLYDPDTLELLWHHQRLIRVGARIAWTANNQLMFLLKDPPGYLINPENGAVLEEINRDSSTPIPVPNSGYLANYNPHDGHTIYDAVTGELLLTLKGSTNDYSLVWMPDGEHAIFFPKESSIEIWNVKRSEVIQELETPFKYYQVWGAGFSADERYFAYFATMIDLELERRIERVEVWDLVTGKTLTVNELDGLPSDHGWQLNEQTFAIDRGIVVHINGSVAETAHLHGYERETRRAYQRPDGLLVVLSDAVMLYDKDFALINTTLGHDGEGYTRGAFSPDGQVLAIGSSTRFYVWDVAQNELVTAYIEQGGFYGGWADWSPSGDTLAIGSFLKGQIHLWDKKTQTIQNTIDTGYHVCEIEWLDESSLAVSATDRQPEFDEVVCPESHFLLVFDIEQKEPVYLTRYPLNLFYLRRSPDGKYLAFLAQPDYGIEPDTRRLDVWDASLYQTIYTTDSSSLESPQWLPSSSNQIALIEGQALRMLNIESGEERIVMLPEYDSLFESFNLVGDYLVQYGYDSNLIRWYDHSGELLGTSEIAFEGLSRPVMSADGRILGIVNPYMDKAPVMALIELFPPEQ